MFPVPAVNNTEPFVPFLFSFLSFIFIIPAIPSASYFAEGFVITSILSTVFAGNCSNIVAKSPPIILDGLPSIKTRTFEFPRRLTFPSISISTDGKLFKTSVIDELSLVKSLLTLNTFFSNVFC